MDHELITLQNGLKTLFINAPGNTAASLQIWFRAGSALEKKENHGIAHFLEHMFFKGTPSRPGSAIAHEVESFGGELNAFTSFDYTCYYINSPINHIQQSIEILLDMVSSPEFKVEDILPERNVVLEEFKRSLDNPAQFAFSRLQSKAFTRGYAHPILGSPKHIATFKRDQLIEFRKKYYNLSNALFVISGDLKKRESLVKTIEKYHLPQGELSSFPPFKLKEKSTLDFHQRDTSMIQLTLCFQAPLFKEKEAPQEDLALNCLGHGESSILHQSLVIEDSLANSCACSTMFMHKGGLHLIKVTFPEKNRIKVLKKLEQIILKTIRDGLPADDIQKIKNQYIASKIYDKESLESYAFSLGHSYASTGDIKAEEKFITRIKNSSVTEVNTALHNLFKKPMHISMQTPTIERKKAKSYEEHLKKFQDNLQRKIHQIRPQITPLYKSKYSQYDPQVKLLEIKPGIRLIYRHNPMNPTFVFHAYIKGGITEENVKTNGLYQLLSSTMTKGYGKTSYQKMKKELDLYSAQLSSFSGKNAYGVTMHGQSEHFKALSNHFFGTFLNPALKNDFLKHEKELTLRTQEFHAKDPVKECFSRASEIFFNEHPYALPIFGTPQSIKAITNKLIRETHQRNIQTKEVLFTYCGDQPLEDILDKMTSFLESLPPRKKAKKERKKILPLKGINEFIPFEREQTHIFTGIPTKSLENKENLILKMLTTHLLGQSSELFVEVRDRQGLCYTAQPIHFSALEAGYWGIYMGSGNDKVKAALKAISKILNGIKEKGLSEDEFKRIKIMIAGQNLLNIQTNDDYANIYSVTTLQGQSLDFYHDSNRKIEQLSYDEFSKGLRKILSQKWSTLVIGKENPWA